jgi:uncharacterized membrane protein YgaE (UPF0421/DUF939 family)
MQCVSFENEITRNTPHYATVTDVIYKVFQKNYKNLQNFRNIRRQQRTICEEDEENETHN